MMNSGKPNTPGHGEHLEIWFKSTKSGGKRAYYFSTFAARALPLPRVDAELWIATGVASEVADHPLKLV